MNVTRTLCAALLLAACSSTPHGAPGSLPEVDALSEADSGWMVLEDMQGARHDLSAALSGGRGVALVFWQTWCASCLREAPRLVEAARRLSGQVEFYGVVSGPDGAVDEAAVASTARRLGLPYPQVRDRSTQLARRFGVLGTPTIVVIEPSGRISHNGHELPPAWAAR